MPDKTEGDIAFTTRTTAEITFSNGQIDVMDLFRFFDRVTDKDVTTDTLVEFVIDVDRPLPAVTGIRITWES